MEQYSTGSRFQRPTSSPVLVPKTNIGSNVGFWLFHPGCVVHDCSQQVLRLCPPRFCTDARWPRGAPDNKVSQGPWEDAQRHVCSVGTDNCFLFCLVPTVMSVRPQAKLPSSYCILSGAATGVWFQLHPRRQNSNIFDRWQPTPVAAPDHPSPQIKIIALGRATPHFGLPSLR